MEEEVLDALLEDSDEVDPIVVLRVRGRWRTLRLGVQKECSPTRALGFYKLRVLL